MACSRDGSRGPRDCLAGAAVDGQPHLERRAAADPLTVGAQAAADGYVTTLLGRRRSIPELRAANRQTRSLGERLAVNTVMQGTAADVIKVAMVRIRDRLLREGRASRLVLQVHDELLLEVPEVETSAVRELVRAEMVGAYPLDPPLAVEVGVGDTWADAKA